MTGRDLSDSCHVWFQVGVAKCFLTVSLIENTTVLGGYGCEETPLGVLQHGDVVLILLPESAEDNNNNTIRCLVCCHVLVALGCQCAHGKDCLGNHFGCLRGYRQQYS